MTIKPLSNQKSSEKKEAHGHQESASANLTDSNVRSNVEGSPQRRNDVFEDMNRHRRSPHKSSSSSRSKRDHHKREQRDHHKREQREKAVSPQYHAASVHSPHASPSSCGISKSPKHNLTETGAGSSQSPNNLNNLLEETFSGYNSGDEHLVPKEGLLTTDEWKDRDEQFVKAMSERGFIIQDIVEDGACLFRAISLQIYGDQEMHDVIRQQTMDYIYQNREYFAHFITEDITSYVKRKRNKESHGNHIEIQAMSEIFNRTVELYCYQPTPTNIFNSERINNGYDPLRLSYQRGSHYNAIIDPYNASVGVGLGLAGYKPESQTREAIRLSEQLEIEKTMLEDKLKSTDWEATNEAIEEQIARESYLQWCRDNLHGNNPKTTTTTTSSSATMSCPSSSGSCSGSVASTSTALPSTVTLATLKSLEPCTSKNSKDHQQTLQYHVSESNTNNMDSQMLSNEMLMAAAESNMTSTDCCESDDTNSGASSSTASDIYNEQMQLYKKSLKMNRNCCSRRMKRRHRDIDESKKCSEFNGSPNSSSAIDGCRRKRLKQLK